MLRRAYSALRERPARKFALKFALFGAILSCVYYFPYAEVGLSESWSRSYLGLYARLAGSLLTLTDPSIQIVGTQIGGRFPMEIVKNCDAMDVTILYVSAVLALPAFSRRHGLALGVGTLAIILLNVLRITSLYYVGVHAPDWFHVLHLEVWPLLLVACTSLGFVLTARWIAEGTLRGRANGSLEAASTP